MINILYVVKKIKYSCNYYKDFYNFLKKKTNLIVCKPPFTASNFKNHNPNIILVGFDITDCGSNAPNEFINNDLNLPLYIILNKEYSAIDKKLDWIVSKNPIKCFTVHHEFERYSNITNIPFYKIMWSADHNIFKKYNKGYKYDLIFTGVIRKEQTDNIRQKIYNKLNLLKKYNLKINAAILVDNKFTNKKYNYSNEEYAKLINDTKICLTTTGPADLVGTRYFEISASNKAMILCNRMDKNVYSDMFIDNFNCVMFDDENDFIKKFKYYIKHENERLKIVKNAYKHFQKNLNWNVQIDKFIKHI